MTLLRPRSETAQACLALAIAAAGAIVASLVHFPAPYLTGPAIAVTAAGLMGARLAVPGRLADVAMILIGMSIGAGVTPGVLDTARQWPASFVLLAFSLLAIMIVSSYWLRRHFAYDRKTALLASSPGHLSYVLSLSTDTNADIRQIGLVQSIRVLALTLIVPVVVSAMGGEIDPDQGPAAAMSVLSIALTFILSILVGLVLKRFRLPAALLVGGMIVSTVSHLTGTIEGVMPLWLQIPAFLIMGALIGSRFGGVTLAMLRSAFSAGIAITVIASVLAAAFALLVAGLFDLPTGQLLIAFMPGGVEAMIAIAVLLDADPTFVAAHHVMRLFILTALVPIMLGRRRTS
ncbi:AbrB family transcriptional regulator [Pararhizobium haloflavum]|uniref:AbrB family transcriptional regulator n=1 Tax=Pararhizobium haloflavum TaxID=2037914 RepID=UPI000C182A05|nr:AbrB family transcriptional regulator [Pararhizobium haloflavum]